MGRNAAVSVEGRGSGRRRGSRGRGWKRMALFLGFRPYFFLFFSFSLFHFAFMIRMYF